MISREITIDPLRAEALVDMVQAQAEVRLPLRIEQRPPPGLHSRRVKSRRAPELTGLGRGKRQGWFAGSRRAAGGPLGSGVKREERGDEQGACSEELHMG